MTPAKYRKKPVVIEAMQWDGTQEGATPIIDWVRAGGGKARWVDSASEIVDTRWVEVPAHIAVDTLEGTMRVAPSNWVIRGVQGEHYPCKPDIFATTYEPAEDAA